MSGGKELLVAVAQAVTTGLGASNCDVVLVSLSVSALTEAGKGGLGPSSLHGLFATFTRAAELRAAEADGQLGKALTTALGNRGPPSSGVYWFKSKDEGSIIKVNVPKDSNALPAAATPDQPFEAAVKPQGVHREPGVRCDSEDALSREVC